VPPAGNLARRIVDYDADFALDVLALVVERLDGPSDERDPARLHGFLSRGDAGSEISKTTVEWKAGFAHRERLRALGLELAELLRV
jgi:hypothetical protein